MENELVAQVSMKQEMELAMKLLEKDIHEKQVRMGEADVHMHPGCKCFSKAKRNTADLLR